MINSILPFFAAAASWHPAWTADLTVLQVTAEPGAMLHRFAEVNSKDGSQFSINWGDGSPENQELSHTYQTPGKYYVAIKNAASLMTDWSDNLVTEAVQCSNQLERASGMLRGTTKLRTVRDTFVLPPIQWVDNMFSGSGITWLNMAIPDTVTNMGYFLNYATLCRLGDRLRIPAGVRYLERTFWLCPIGRNIADLLPAEFTASQIDMEYTFYLSTELTGEAPAAKLWGNPDRFVRHEGCFSDCKALSNYNAIPADWGGTFDCGAVLNPLVTTRLLEPLAEIMDEPSPGSYETTLTYQSTRGELDDELIRIIGVTGLIPPVVKQERPTLLTPEYIERRVGEYEVAMFDRIMK